MLAYCLCWKPLLWKKKCTSWHSPTALWIRSWNEHTCILSCTGHEGLGMFIFMGESYFLDPSVHWNRSALDPRWKELQGVQVLWDVSRVSSSPGQKQQSWAMHWIVSLPQTGCGHVKGLPAETLHPAAGNLLLVGLEALLASCWSVGRSSQ